MTGHHDRAMPCFAHVGRWCRFWVRQDQLFDFFKHWLAREALLQDQQGFFGLQVSCSACYLQQL